MQANEKQDINFSIKSAYLGLISYVVLISIVVLIFIFGS